MEDDVKKCPELYYRNCNNKMLMCKQCLAGYGTKGFYYEPKEDIGEHPYNPVKEKKKSLIKSSQVKAGRKAELDVADSIVRGTLNSGAINNDGDLVLFPGSYVIRVEVKYRHNTGNFSVSKSEWNKAKASGVRCFIIQSQSGRAVFMDESLFMEILSQLKYQLMQVGEDESN